MGSNKLVTLIVGDDDGWKLNFDYQAWAKDKVFHIGDTLVFKYKPPNHNVYKVNGTGFQDCTKPTENEALTSGNDKIPLNTAGNKWYICGVKNHCDRSGHEAFHYRCGQVFCGPWDHLLWMPSLHGRHPCNLSNCGLIHSYTKLKFSI